MTIDVEKKHETTWSTTLTSAQLREILVKALRDEFYAPHYGLRLEVMRVIPADPDAEERLPTIECDLVADHDWMLKPRADAEVEAEA